MTNPQPSWAPIVHGRTYRVDFRPHLMVIPDWFLDADISFVRDYIRASTRSAEKLHDGPRWLFVKTDRFQMAGTTCMASAVSADMTHDRPDAGSGGTGRPLYVFLGWATRDLSADPPPMNVEYYKQLYQFVRNRWNNAPPDDATDVVSAMIDHFPPLDNESQIVRLSPGFVTPDSEKSTYNVWPDSRRAALWASAAQQSSPISLCIGMARPRDVEESPLSNITVAGSDECVILERMLKSAPGGKGRPSTSSRYESGYKADGRFYSQQESEFSASSPPRRQSVMTSVMELILSALYSFLRTVGLGDRERPKSSPASDQVGAPLVGMREILRPVRPTTGRSKDDAFDAFEEPDPSAARRILPPTATDAEDSAATKPKANTRQDGMKM